jgi:hypothetical protein
LYARAPSAPDKPSPQERVTVRQRLDWLRRGPHGYAPQPYEQLAEFYRRTGQEAEGHRVLLEKHRRRRTTLHMPGRLLGYMLDGLVRYGYRTSLAGIWLATFWALGTLAFTLERRVDPTVTEAFQDAEAADPTARDHLGAGIAIEAVAHGACSRQLAGSLWDWIAG